MRGRKRMVFWLLCLLAAGGVLTGCGGRAAERELDIEDWQSWRIGTPLAWSSDYYLSEQVRIPNLYLYDSIGDCIMALRFGYVGRHCCGRAVRLQHGGGVFGPRDPG